MLRVVFQSLVVVGLTVFTQIGGLAWLVSRVFVRKWLAFGLIYIALTGASVALAPSFGRVALNCFDRGPLHVQSMLYCALNRHYVAPELKAVLDETAAEMDRQFPGTQTLVLDANFPFFDGFPLLPHLSHDDGEKVDIALYYRDATGYLPGATRSPIGYFAFEHGPTECSRKWPSLRWDMGLLQPFWRDYALDGPRTKAVLDVLSDHERVGKIFVEPHLVRRLGAAHSSIRFQGCRAARHDDHIHLQLR